MPESNRIQASIPSGCEVIHNERGTAAGFYLNLEDKHLFVTPGVPFEMEGMLEGFIMPRLREVVDSEHYVARTMLKVYGLPESEINERIRPMLHRNRNPLLGLLPEQGTITVEIVAIGATASEAQALIDTDTAALYAELGANVISEDDRAMHEVTGDLLSERGLTVATTEVGSAGLLAARLTEPRGSDRWFRSGLVLSPLAAARLLEETPLDDEEAARMLARQARERTLADIGVGVSALFEPSNQSTRLPYRTVCIALSTSQEEWSDTLRFRVGRARQWAAEAALASIRQHLLDYE
jgi:nicotinamide-nucleotide amidase